MLSTKHNYAGLIFFVIFTILTAALYTYALYTPEHKGTPLMSAMITSLLALITCPSVTTVYLNSVYNKHLLTNEFKFYGKIEALRYYMTDTGEYLRGVILFLYLFTGASVFANRLEAIVISLFLSLVFAFMVNLYINKFKDYLIERSDAPNSP